MVTSMATSSLEKGQKPCLQRAHQSLDIQAVEMNIQAYPPVSVGGGLVIRLDSQQSKIPKNPEVGWLRSNSAKTFVNAFAFPGLGQRLAQGIQHIKTDLCSLVHNDCF